MVSPYNVKSPKAHWTLIDVLFTNDDWALAIGEWDQKRRLAVRWNGEGDSIGNPMSRGIATWFVLPNEFIEHIMPLIPKDKRQLAEVLLKERDAA